MTNPITVLAIDPGYDRLGWAVANIHGTKLELVAYDCLTPSTTNNEQRLLTVATTITALIKTHLPTELAIEEVFFSSNVSTAMKVSEVRGCVMGAALTAELSVFNYNPGTIKLAAAGHGKATKAEVEKMVRLQLNLPSAALLDDTIDALAIVITHAAHRKLQLST